MKGLSGFLETKRDKFPRLYFLSNEELIDIFGKGREVVTQTPDENEKPQEKSFLGNLFEGLDSIKFTSELFICTLVSKQGEEVGLVKHVPTNKISAERWLVELEKQMQNSIKF